MKAKTSWKFSCPLDQVNLNRIVREAGTDTVCVRVTIENKVYTLVREGHHLSIPDTDTKPGFFGVLPKAEVSSNPFISKVHRNSSGEPVVVFLAPQAADLIPELCTKWRIYVGDFTGQVLDRVKTLVEVF